MKNQLIRRLVVLLLLSVFTCAGLLILTACEPAKFYFDYDELKENVVRVEYIYYDNPNAKELNEFIFDKSDQMLPFDFEKMEIRQVLPDEQLDDFLKALSEQEFMEHWIHLDSPKSNSIRVIYSNGDFEVISAGRGNWYSGSFYADGQVKRFIGDAISDAFIEKWFDIQN